MPTKENKRNVNKCFVKEAINEKKKNGNFEVYTFEMPLKIAVQGYRDLQKRKNETSINVSLKKIKEKQKRQFRSIYLRNNVENAVQKPEPTKEKNETLINVSLKKIKKNGNSKYTHLRNAVEKRRPEKPVPTKEKNETLINETFISLINVSRSLKKHITICFLSFF
jgi:hypothetical protein